VPKPRTTLLTPPHPLQPTTNYFLGSKLPLRCPPYHSLHSDGVVVVAFVASSSVAAAAAAATGTATLAWEIRVLLEDDLD
jgi:hypothetical protein